MSTNKQTKLSSNKKAISKTWIVIFKIVLIIAIYVIISSLVRFDILNRQYKALLVPIGVNIILAVSLNVVTGFLGELSLGHAGFMSIGAFTGALFTLNMDMPGTLEFIIAILLGGTIAAIFGFFIGVPALRLRGDYLAIVTLAFGEIIKAIIKFLNLPSGKDAAGNVKMVKGTMGLSGIETYADYTWVYVALVIVIVICANLIKSRHGRIITSIRDNYLAAESIGIHVSRYKILAFVIAAFFAGVAGVISGHNVPIIKPNDYDYNKSIDILVFVVLGGMGSIKGSIIAATVLTVLPEILRPIKDYRMLMYAILLIAMMLFNNSKFRAGLNENKSLAKLTGLLKFGR
ncbi:MAG: branched-chain amino acid transporter permease [Herbinix sp.]|jgi:branched-chain amino acid transport system permease protein|nr:branched-chain amino acid transporter permease [Herbinix sp.]